MDLTNPHYALLGKLIEAFQEIKNEEPNNPNALFRLVSDTAQKKLLMRWQSLIIMMY